MSEARAGYPYSFRCRRSGNCCAIPGGFVRVDEGERARIAAHLGMSTEAFARRYLQPDGSRLKEGLGGRCVFLVEGAEAACSIHEVKPHKCRTWPFWPEVLEDEALLQLVQRTCPGVEPCEP